MKTNFTYLYLDEGTDFESQELYWLDSNDNPVDLSTYTLTAKMNKHTDADPALSPPITMTVSVTDAVQGEYTLVVPSNQPVSPIVYIFNVIATSATNKKTKIAEGQVIVRPSV